jgi:hypothetical protein
MIPSGQLSLADCFVSYRIWLYLFSCIDESTKELICLIESPPTQLPFPSHHSATYSYYQKSSTPYCLFFICWNPMSNAINPQLLAHFFIRLFFVLQSS